MQRLPKAKLQFAFEGFSKVKNIRLKAALPSLKKIRQTFK